MAAVTLTIGGRRYEVACRDGEEAHLQMLGQAVDGKAREIQQAVGGVNEVRLMLLVALSMADLANDAVSEPGELDGLAEALETLAERIEAVAHRLEKPQPSA